jgi:hypothetical protein
MNPLSKVEPATSRSQDAKWASRGWSDEMTSEAVQRRLEKLEQLYQAWLELKRLPLRGGEERPARIR